MKPILVVLLLASIAVQLPTSPAQATTQTVCDQMCPGAAATTLTMCEQGLFCTCYCDGSPGVIVGGYIATCDQVNAAAEVWQELCPSAGPPAVQIGSCAPPNPGS